MYNTVINIPHPAEMTTGGRVFPFPYILLPGTLSTLLIFAVIVGLVYRLYYRDRHNPGPEANPYLQRINLHLPGTVQTELAVDLR